MEWLKALLKKEKKGAKKMIENYQPRTLIISHETWKQLTAEEKCRYMKHFDIIETMDNSYVKRRIFEVQENQVAS